LADGRLGHTKATRCAPEVELLGNGQEHADVAELHAISVADGYGHIILLAGRESGGYAWFMLETTLLALFAGFFFGNGLPYYVAGSTGEGVNPSPFPKTASVNVVNGFAAMAIGAIAWHFVDRTRFPVGAWVGASIGVLSVGLIHARLWKNDPWGRGTK
jgi:hypothetical protein